MVAPIDEASGWDAPPSPDRKEQLMIADRVYRFNSVGDVQAMEPKKKNLQEEKKQPRGNCPCCQSKTRKKDGKLCNLCRRMRDDELDNFL